MIGNTRHFYWPFFLLDVIRRGKTHGSVTNFGMERTDSETGSACDWIALLILERPRNKREIVDVLPAGWYS